MEIPCGSLQLRRAKDVLESQPLVVVGVWGPLDVAVENAVLFSFGKVEGEAGGGGGEGEGGLVLITERGTSRDVEYSGNDTKDVSHQAPTLKHEI